ncbi:hypothetical protein BDV93DRAFT_605741 [Ceratobasidium sp. AG-I]|nr:hypothetical protein BDV93DRAFT_605741 [Ceratobasidium sp. AG-I]
MEAPPTLHLETADTAESHPPASSSRSRRSSARRQRPPLRSSPLAGPSYAADSVGNVIQHGSALGEEIAWRRSQLHAGLNDEELARLAALSDSVPMPSTLHSASVSTDALPSPKGGSDASDHSLHPPVRRARPSFISLAPPSPGPTSPGPDSAPLEPPSPPTLRARHSSPNIAREASRPSSAPGPSRPRDHVIDKPAGHWMTAAPAQSFSRGAIHSAGVVLPVKASSRSGQRIRRKSLPAKPSRAVSKPSSPTSESHSPTSPVSKPEVTQPTLSSKKSTRSLRSLKSISRMFKPEEEHGQPAHQEPVPPVPALPSPLPLSRTSSTSGHSSMGGPSTPTALSMPSSPTANRSGHLHVLNPSAAQSKFSVDEPDVMQAELGMDVGGAGKEVGTGRVRKLWAKVMSGVRKRDRA